MVVRTTTCHRAGHTYLTHLIQESFRTPEGPRSRTVCSITVARVQP